MAWTYLSHLLEDEEAGRKDRVRFLIGDTDETTQYVLDEEIRFALSKHNNDEILAAIQLCEAIIMRLSREASYSIESYRIELSRRAEVFRATVDRLKKKRAPSSPMAMDSHSSYFNRFRRIYEPGYRWGANGHRL